MHISWLRARITIQKNETVTDRYGNHKSVWTDWFTCWATGKSGGRSADETEEAGHTEERNRIEFTVRYCSETAAVDSTHYRVLLGERIYNIKSVDDMDFRRVSRKLITELVER